MPKSKKKIKTQSLSPEEALQFLEDMRRLPESIDEQTQAISLRIPQNILRAVKARAKNDGKKYQSLIIAYIRKGLEQGL